MATFLLGAGDAIKHQFTAKDVSSTNTTFRLFSKITFGLCIFASILVGGTEYFGKPINCDPGSSGLGKDLLNDHCWIHGTKHVPETSKEHFGCHYKKGKGAEEDELVFYQWVVFMLVINAIVFKIPDLIWKSYEDGLMKAFFSGKGLKSKLLSDDDTNQHLDTIDLNYYKKLKGQNNYYYYVFLFCQLLNIAMLALNWWATDTFLGGNFHSYGSDVYDYYSYSKSERTEKLKTGELFDPMCNAFPTKVGCDLKLGSTSGSGSTTNGFCILSQNIVNQKIYLFLWFWFVLMFVIGTFQMIYEIAVLAIPSIRSFIIARQTGTFNTGEMKRYIEHDCNHGDWFILHQIGKNTNKDFFYRFIEKVSSRGQSKQLLQLHPNDTVAIPMKELESNQMYPSPNI